MITVPWLLAARGISLDRDTGYLSIFSVLAALNAENFPLLFPQLTIVGLLRRDKDDPQEGKVALSIYGKGEKLFDSEIPFDFKDKLNNQVTAQFQGLVVGSAGDLKFELRIKKKLLASYVVAINGPPVAIAKQPTQAAESSTAKTNKTPARAAKKKKTSKPR